MLRSCDAVKNEPVTTSTQETQSRKVTLMTLQLEVWSDYNCPWCFLASTSIEKLAESHGVAVQWRSYELRPKGSPPINPEYLARIAQVRPQMETMAKSQYGVTIHSGRFGIDSRPALIATKYAESQGEGAAFHRAVFSAYWEKAQDIEEREVLASIALENGLERDAFLAGLDDPIWDRQVQEEVETAQQMGISGVPALLFQGKYMLSGAQPYDQLVNVLKQVQQREGIR